MKNAIVISGILLAAAALTPAAQGAKVKAIWKKDCAMCHGPKGTANTPIGRRFHVPDLRSPKFQASLTDAQIVKTIKDGFKVNGQEKMPSFGNKLSEKEIKGLVKHVRELKKD